MTTFTQHRNAVRRLLIAQRYAMTASNRRAQQAQLTERLAAMLLAQAANHMTALYMPHAGEPDVLAAMLLAHQTRDCLFALPVVVGKAQPLRFARWALGDALQTGAYGIREPDQKQWVTPDTIVAPCVGISEHEGQYYRLGYGGGYYDRTVSQLREQGHRVALVGVTWVDALCCLGPHSHDVALDKLLMGHK